MKNCETSVLGLLYFVIRVVALHIGIVIMLCTHVAFFSDKILMSF